jgi:protocatechuate 3,4-dioxygenase beta subunit
MFSRRQIGYMGLGGLLLPATARAAALSALPSQTEGPYYPDVLPGDTDNDLVRIADAARHAGGEILELSGIVRDVSGHPLGGAGIEIWQADVGGRYIATADASGPVPKDAWFQGYGRMTAGEDGAYRFRTIRPVSYGQGGVTRCPHIHIKLHRPDTRRVITSQLYVKDEPRNAADWLFNRLTDSEKEAASMPLLPTGDAHWRAALDLVVG